MVCHQTGPRGWPEIQLDGAILGEGLRASLEGTPALLGVDKESFQKPIVISPGF